MLKMVVMCLLLVAVLTVGIAGATNETAAPTQFSLIDMGSAGGAGCIVPTSINASGDVVGYAGLTECGPWHAFLYTNGTMINLGTLGGRLSLARAINNSGEVVGGYENGQGVRRAFRYANGFMTDLGDLLGVPGGQTEAKAINNRGEIVGYSQITQMQGSPPQYPTHAFLLKDRKGQGDVIDLGTLGGQFSLANSINNRGDIVGQATPQEGDTRAFLYADGTMLNLGTLGGVMSWANAINDRGQVVGVSKNISGDRRAFLYEDSTMKDIGISGYDGAAAINNRGQIVGKGGVGAYQSQGAFLYENGSAYDLNNLLDATGIGWTIVFPHAINDLGQIAAEALDAQGLRHGVILNPVK